MYLVPNRSRRVFWMSSLLLILTLPVIGQKNFLDGYIVKNNKDSLRGQIDFKDWEISPAEIVFQSGGKTSTLSVNELLAFGVSGDRYETHTVHIDPYSTTPARLTTQGEVGSPYDTTAFLQVLVTGKVTLWEFRTKLQANYFFVDGKDGKPYQLRLITTIFEQENGQNSFRQEELYKNQLTYLLKDCPVVSRRIARTPYDAVALRKLIFAYDYCGKDTVEKNLSSGKEGVRLFAFAGYANSSAKFSGGTDATTQENWPASSSPVAGVGIYLPLPRNRQQFSFLLDLSWQHFHSESSVEHLSTTASNVGYIDYKSINLDILFRYSYPAKKVRPFLEGGLANGFLAGVKDYETYHDDFGNNTYSYPLLYTSARTYVPAWVAGAGVSAGRWNIEGRVQGSQGIVLSRNTATHIFTWYVLAAFRL